MPQCPITDVTPALQSIPSVCCSVTRLIIGLCSVYKVDFSHTLGYIWATCRVQDETVSRVNSERHELPSVAWSCIHA